MKYGTILGLGKTYYTRATGNHNKIIQYVHGKSPFFRDAEQVELLPEDFPVVGDRVMLRWKGHKHRPGTLVRIFQDGKKKGKGSVKIDGRLEAVTCELNRLRKITPKDYIMPPRSEEIGIVIKEPVMHFKP